jgi:two-component system sensor histidine kinase HupT/HoxJ
LEISAHAENGEIVVFFRDNGTGIANEALDKIFDPFYTTKPVGKGTGLGLSVSYGIIERHGGLLSASNQTQGGAQFVLRLPRNSA